MFMDWIPCTSIIPIVLLIIWEEVLQKIPNILFFFILVNILLLAAWRMAAFFMHRLILYLLGNLIIFMISLNMCQRSIKIIFVVVIHWVNKVKLIADHITLYRAISIIGILMIKFIHSLIMMLLCSSPFFNNYHLLTGGISFLFIKATIHIQLWVLVLLWLSKVFIFIKSAFSLILFINLLILLLI
jgi:hypothetical protein